MSRRNKYNARKTTVFGITFDSKHEAERYLILKSMEDTGEITELELQPRWPLVVNKVNIGRYTADFMYRDSTGRRVVEDAKSGPTRTRDYVLRKKLVLALYGVEVREV